jgi:DNA-binding NtrC family response regulator
MSKVIAIIDDEQEMQFLYELMMEDYIQGQTIELKFFSDAREFLNWFPHNQPDLVMTDLNMPHLSGADITRMIRAQNPTIPIYIVSGYEQTEYEELMKELKINRFLEKPLDYDQLLDLIEQDLGIKAP